MAFKEYTPEEQKKILSELDDDRKVILFCPIHKYTAGAGQVPTMGCKTCAEMDWKYRFAVVPPHKRQEAVELMYEVVRKMVEMVEARKFDLKVTKPTWEIEKGKES